VERTAAFGSSRSSHRQALTRRLDGKESPPPLSAPRAPAGVGHLGSGPGRALTKAQAPGCERQAPPRQLWREWLRRFDHAAIFVMIAGTYTPLTVRLPGARSVGLTAGIWSAAVAGVAAKLCQPRRVEAMSVALYLSAGLGRRGRRRTAAGVVQRPHAASSTRQG
jgi:hypothetical protein